MKELKQEHDDKTLPPAQGHHNNELKIKRKKYLKFIKYFWVNVASCFFWLFTLHKNCLSPSLYIYSSSFTFVSITQCNYLIPEFWCQTVMAELCEVDLTWCKAQHAAQNRAKWRLLLPYIPQGTKRIKCESKNSINSKFTNIS